MGPLQLHLGPRQAAINWLPLEVGKAATPARPWSESLQLNLISEPS